MNIRRHLKSIILASTLALSCGIIPTSFAANYQVINVDSWDTLNVRSGAGTGYDVVSEIPASADKIKITSSERDVGGSTWVKIKWNGKSGWVNKRYLSVAANTVNNNMKQTYYNPEPATNTYTTYTPPRATSNSHTHPANRCTRSITHSHAGPTEHSHRYSCQKGRQQQSNGNIDIYGNQRTSQNANTHRHPANECTRSISHTHANGQRNHSHRYSCRNNGRQQQTAYTPRQNGNTHRHPANRCTRSISHTHAGAANHSHRYSCQNNRGRQQVAQTNRLQHTHGKSQCVSAINHAHKGGARMHRHQCPSNRNQSANSHTHAANSLTRARTHSHPYQDRRHSHRYGR
ncbi:MAG TPA: hypothetical protein ENJ51_01560 [Leucothrix mucor]|uniref:SH3b domain-containing protein n=1 Tax=Leucothrix mucor TaxID=45248 RepID=A0A7V2SYI1_LEUMU|nr:hypothetical protein [Leucothrix mucor]